MTRYISMFSARAHLKFSARKLFLCRHLEKNSDHLFNVSLSLFDFNMESFSSRQTLQLFPPAVYAGIRLMIDHLMV